MRDMLDVIYLEVGMPCAIEEWVGVVELSHGRRRKLIDPGNSTSPAQLPSELTLTTQDSRR